MSAWPERLSSSPLSLLMSCCPSSQLEGARDIYQACTVNANTSSGSGRRPEWTPHGRYTVNKEQPGIKSVGRAGRLVMAPGECQSLVFLSHRAQKRTTAACQAHLT